MRVRGGIWGEHLVLALHSNVRRRVDRVRSGERQGKRISGKGKRKEKNSCACVKERKESERKMLAGGQGLKGKQAPGRPARQGNGPAVGGGEGAFRKKRNQKKRPW